MYDWHGEELTRREEMLLNPPDKLDLSDGITRFELRIAGAKTLINKIVPEIKAAFTTFPRPPHEIYWKTRNEKIQGDMDKYGVRPPPGDRTVLYIEDYPAWDDYMRLTREYRQLRAQLKHSQEVMIKTLERIRERNEKKRGKSKKIDDGVKYDAERNGR